MQRVYENIAYISTHFATFCQLCKRYFVLGPREHTLSLENIKT